jgi:glycosyltransferase involved in cell wall biosynthesis
MRIVMFTNTYLPHVGGVARSVSTYEEEFRRRGHDVRIVAPEFEGAQDSSESVLRMPAIQNFNGSDFSVRIPQPGMLADFVDSIRPDLLHTHHPFLLGDAALRLAWSRRLPLVFTYHTMYEQYTHYVPLDSDAIKRFVIQMSTEYCNLCDHVIAPSESVAKVLADRGVAVPISSIPTGINLELYGSGNGQAFRQKFGIDPRAIVVGHVGRLAAEKNLDYLAEGVGHFLAMQTDALFLIVGQGDAADSMRRILDGHAKPHRVIAAGQQTGHDLADAYAAMDVFAFSSKSETQGMVLAEAMAAGVPAVALDAPGAREIVNDSNGRLLNADATPDDFAAALVEMTRDAARLEQLRAQARRTAREFSLETCADRLLRVYEELVRKSSPRLAPDADPWDRLLARLEIEWNLLVEKTTALAAAAVETETTRSRLE